MGEVILNRFRIEERLGDGGFGSVYAAWDERLQRRVAVKVIPSTRAGERFEREARASARLNHRGIVTLYEVGRDERRAYLVSELVEGWTLREHFAAGTLSDRDVALIGAELCDAIEHAHERGVIHRDLKPENVMVRADGVAKLMDFGVARLEGATPLTRAGDIVGTIAYMSPEQANADPVSGATDVYSLALVLYEAWSGGNPALRSSPAATAMAISGGVPALAEPRPGLPPELTDAIDSCLQSDAEWRPAPSELGDLLRELAPRLDDECCVPLPETVARRQRALGSRPVRVGAVIALASAIAGMAAAGLAGPALLAALILGPISLLCSPRDWLVVPATVALGAAAVPAAGAGLAASATSATRRGLTAAAAFLAAWAIAVVSQVDLLGFDVSPPPAGWELSAAAAADAVLEPLLAPAPLALLGAWVLGALVLGRILEASTAMRILGALLWAATMLSAQHLIRGADAGTADPWLAAALLSAALLASAANAHGRAGRESVAPSEPERLRPIARSSPRPA